MTCGFTYKIVFLNEDGYVVDTDRVDVEVPESAYPEDDQDSASTKAYEWAEDNLCLYGASDFECSLENAY